MGEQLGQACSEGVVSALEYLRGDAVFTSHFTTGHLLDGLGDLQLATVGCLIISWVVGSCGNSATASTDIVDLRFRRT